MDTKQSFTIKVIRELLKHNFSVFLHNKEHIDGYGGWFSTDTDEEEFVVAMKHPMGFEILIHEYCHFLQWKEDKKSWDESEKYYNLLFDWISDLSMEVSETDLNQSLLTILKIEHDCEKRVLKLVSLNPIEDFDTDKYKRAANAYLWSYHTNKELRKRPKIPVYSERLLENMPNLFANDLSYYLDTSNLTSNMKQALLLEYEEN